MIRYCDILTTPTYVVRLSTGLIYRVIARSMESDTYEAPPTVRWWHCIRTDDGLLFHADLTPSEVRATDLSPIPELSVSK